MFSRFSLSFLLVALFSFSVFSQTLTNDTAPQDSFKVKPLRLAAAGLATVSMVGVPLIYLQNAWWKEESRGFHFDPLFDGVDLKYARNLDKFGHFFGGVLVSDIGDMWLNWAGLKPKTAAWGGAAMGIFYQLSIEYKDAFAPTWGFSVWDLGSGTLGSLTIVARAYYPKIMNAVDFKMSYYIHNRHHFNLADQQHPDQAPHKPINYWIDDYPNQMYWADLSLTQIFNYEPKWYNAFTFSMGTGLDYTQILTPENKIRGGNRTYALSVGYDFEQISRNWRSPLGKKVMHFLNYIKVPAPTLFVSPQMQFKPIYF